MRRSLLFLPLVPAVLALPACGGGAAEETAASSPAPSSAATSSTAASSAPGSASADGAADVEFDDQSGAGDTATVARVTAPEAGFVVVLLEEDDDDRPVAERLLGSAAVQAGSSTDVAVPLDPALAESTELEAALYADTDGDGAFDPAADRPVPEPDDDDDDDDEVDDDAEYRVG